VIGYGPFGAAAGAAVGHLFDNDKIYEVGAAIGHFFDDDNNNGIRVVCPYCQVEIQIPSEGLYICYNCKKEFFNGDINNMNDKDFFTVSFFSLLAKLCKADGIVSKEEIDIVSDHMKYRLELNEEEIVIAKFIFRTAKDSLVSHQEIASNLYERYKDNTNLLTVIVDDLFELAFTDGIIHEKEEKFIRDIIGIFHLDSSVYDQIECYIQDFNKYYDILGCSRNDDIEKIKTSYRDLIRDYHPDTIASKNLAPDFIEFANRKSSEIIEAYNIIMKERGH
jgi:DnaJ like chaperone protein